MIFYFFGLMGYATGSPSRGSAHQQPPRDRKINKIVPSPPLISDMQQNPTLDLPSTARFQNIGVYGTNAPNGVVGSGTLVITTCYAPQINNCFPL